jgi:hypothetical protein
MIQGRLLRIYLLTANQITHANEQNYDAESEGYLV